MVMTRREPTPLTRSGGAPWQFGIVIATACALAAPLRAEAVDYTGTVDFSGQVVFSAPIPGIAPNDLTVSIDTSTEATGNGEKCEINATTSDNPDALGVYPDAGAVSADMEISRGGPNIPGGECVVKVTASGTDGVSVSARGAQTVFVPAAAIQNSDLVNVNDIVVRESKAIAGIDKACEVWSKKQLKLRDKCNALLLKKGPAFAAKCKDAGAEPAGCDPGQHVEATLTLAHAANDQQTDPPNAENVDPVALKEPVLCQKRFGKATVGFVNKYVKFVNKKCIATNVDSDSCRNQQAKDSKKKLDQIDKCTGDQAVDGGTGRTVPVVAAPCDVCISGGTINRKCLKSCFEVTLPDLGDGILGDIAECGNGIVQGGEFCDDGNLVTGDCCSSSCTVEAPGTEGPLADPTCTDGLDNDCDTLIDAADPDCQ
jgi:cysteine-rich repeat protein